VPWQLTSLPLCSWIRFSAILLIVCLTAALCYTNAGKGAALPHPKYQTSLFAIVAAIAAIIAV